MRPDLRRLILPLFFCLGGTAILISLALWQLDRLEEKQQIIAEIGARVAEAPVPLPAAPDAETDLYRAVAISGRFLPGALHVLTTQSPGGPGFRVIQPFETDAGRLVLVDRGYLREAEKEAVLDAGPMEITGNLVWPRETDGFTPEPNLARNIWFARDVERMAEAAGTEPVLVAGSAPTGAPAPRPLPVSVNIPNAHLQYAITWSLLALAWLAMSGYFLYRLNRGQTPQDRA